MSPEHRACCLKLVRSSHHPTGEITNEQFLQAFPGAVENGKAALRHFQESILARSSEDLECALIVGFVFGFPTGIEPLLWGLVSKDWHTSHEDIIGLLQDFANPAAIRYLDEAIKLKGHLRYLAYDDYGSYYKKCLWALAAIGTTEAIDVIQSCAESADQVLRAQALYRLQRLAKGT